MGWFEKLAAMGARKPEEPSQAEMQLREQLEDASTDPAATVRYHLRWTGQVQGVGFRYTHTNIARAKGLTGWVMNLDDGSVEMEIQGEPDRILAHLKELHANYERMGNRFRLAEASPRPIDPDEGSFEPRY